MLIIAAIENNKDSFLVYAMVADDNIQNVSATN